MLVLVLSTILLVGEFELFALATLAVGGGIAFLVGALVGLLFALIDTVLLLLVRRMVATIEE